MLRISDCKKPWQTHYIHVNGDLKPCCYAAGRLGNLHRNPDFQSIAEGRLATELQTFVAADRIHPICSGASCVFIRQRVATDQDVADADAFLSTAAVPELPAGMDLAEGLVARARIGEPNSMYQIGMKTFLAGQKDLGVRWFQAASRVGSAIADHFLGMIHFYGNGTAKDDAAAMAYAERSAAEDYAPAHTLLGIIAMTNAPPQVEGHLRRGAELGDPDAWYRLALLYEEGRLVKQNPSEARRHMKIAANRGHAKAKEALATLEATF